MNGDSDLDEAILVAALPGMGIISLLYGPK